MGSLWYRFALLPLPWESPEVKSDCIPVNQSVTTLPEACLTSRSLDLPSCFVLRVQVDSVSLGTVGSAILLLPHEQKPGCFLLRGGMVLMCFLFNMWNGRMT